MTELLETLRSLQSLKDIQGLEKLENKKLEKFGFEDAWKIGNTARELALEKYGHKSVVIDIRLSTGQILFHTVTGPNSALDNDEWVRRKAQTVLRFGYSSFYWGTKLAGKKKSIEENNYVSEAEYATHGGSVPIRVAGIDAVVGALTISGLAQEEDHALALQTLGFYTK